MPPTTPDVSLTDLSFDLRPSRREDVPLEPLVRSATARLADGALRKMVLAALEIARDKLPVEAELTDAVFSPEGAHVELKVGKGRVLSATISIDVSARGDGKGGVVAEIGELRGLGMGLDGILGPFIDRVLDAAVRPGVRHDRRRGHALLITPNEVFEAQGIPLAFDPRGRWEIESNAGYIEAIFLVGKAKKYGRRAGDRKSSSEEE